MLSVTAKFVLIVLVGAGADDLQSEIAKVVKDKDFTRCTFTPLVESSSSGFLGSKQISLHLKLTDTRNDNVRCE